MSLFDHPLARTPAACLGFAARALGVPSSTYRPAIEAEDRGRWLQARMLWLICGLVSFFGAFYSVYFLSIGFYSGVPVGPCCVLASITALRYARSTGRYCRAIDIIGVLLFAMVAFITLFQDGIHSPALWWLGVPTIGALIAGRMTLGAVLSVLFVAQAALFHRSAGSIGPISLRRPTRRCRWRCR
jgi:hypothetical protein